MTSLFLLERYERYCFQWFQLAITANAYLKGVQEGWRYPRACGDGAVVDDDPCRAGGGRGRTGPTWGAAEAGTVRTSKSYVDTYCLSPLLR